MQKHSGMLAWSEPIQQVTTDTQAHLSDSGCSQIHVKLRNKTRAAGTSFTE